MRPELLIDAIVRQTTVLIAQLSTASGLRTPLSKVADQVFLELSTELEQQGVTRKIAADMFGLTLRSYQTKVQRLRAARSEKDGSLWTEVLLFIEQRSEVTRRELLEHFKRDDPQSLGAILSDLLRSKLLIKSGNNGSAKFSLSDAFSKTEAQARASVSALTQVAVYRGHGHAQEIAENFHLDLEEVNAAVDALVLEGRVHRDQAGLLSTKGVTIPVGAEQGWEAAVFDHFQAVLTALGQKVQTPQSRADDQTGGATLTYVIGEQHPLKDEVLALLRDTRERANDLWNRVNAHNRVHGVDPNHQQVSFYFGQSTRKDEDLGS